MVLAISILLNSNCQKSNPNSLQNLDYSKVEFRFYRFDFESKSNKELYAFPISEVDSVVGGKFFVKNKTLDTLVNIHSFGVGKDFMQIHIKNKNILTVVAKAPFSSMTRNYISADCILAPFISANGGLFDKYGFKIKCEGNEKSSYNVYLLNQLAFYVNNRPTP